MAIKNIRQKSKPKAKAGIRNFVADTQAELKKVDWPDKSSVSRACVIIVILMIFFTIYVAGLDVLFSKMVVILKGI